MKRKHLKVLNDCWWYDKTLRLHLTNCFDDSPFTYDRTNIMVKEGNCAIKLLWSLVLMYAIGITGVRWSSLGHWHCGTDYEKKSWTSVDWIKIKPVHTWDVITRKITKCYLLFHKGHVSKYTIVNIRREQR